MNALRGELAIGSRRNRILCFGVFSTIQPAFWFPANLLRNSADRVELIENCAPLLLENAHA